MTETVLDRALAVSLQAQANAGSLIDSDALLHTAVARGRRIRNRRKAAAGLLVTTAVAVSVALTPILRASTSESTTNPTASPATVGLAALPDAPGDTGAASRPDLVASEPGVVHFSVDALAGPARKVSYWTGSGYEAADVQRSDFQVFVTLAHNRAVLPIHESFIRTAPNIAVSPSEDVLIAGKEGTVTTGNASDVGSVGSEISTPSAPVYSLLWQPTNGVWANVQVQTTTLESAVQVAESVRFDKAKRCAFPLSVGTFPAGAKVQSCGVSINAEGQSGIVSSAELTLSAAGRILEIRFLEVPDNPGIKGSLRAGPYSVSADPDGRSWIMSVGSFGVTAIVARKGDYKQSEILRVLGSVRASGDPKNPASW